MDPLALLLVGSVFALRQIHKRIAAKDIPKVPHIPGHQIPLLGNVGALKKLMSEKMHEVYGDAAEAAGERGVVKLCCAGRTILMVASPAAFAAVLQKSSFLRKPKDIYHAMFMFGNSQHSLITHPDGEEHARIRRHLSRFFCAENIARTFDQLAAQMRTTSAAVLAASAGAQEEIAEAPQGPQAGDGPADGHDAARVNGASAPVHGVEGVYRGDKRGALVNVYEMASQNILRVVFKVLLGTESLPQLAVLNDVMEHTRGVPHPFVLWLLQHGLYPGHRRYRRNYAALRKYNTELSQEIYAKPAPRPESTELWACLRHAFPDALADRRQFGDAVANVWVMYFAAYEATAIAVCHTLSALALDQDSQAALAEDLDRLGLLVTPERPAPRACTAEDLAECRVLDAICHESLRLMPPGPTGGFRVLSKDTTIGGYNIPKGSTISLPVWALHHNKLVWGETADQWNPNRWYEASSFASVKRDAQGELRYMPFGGGPSNCIGQNLAVVELKLVVALLVSQLHITMDQERCSVRSVDEYVASLITKVTLQSPGTTWLRMKDRRSAHTPPSNP